MKKFFITTPIYYINAEPSIGSACSTIAADIIARLHRQEGEEVFFLTGTDEHGEKIAEAALKVGLPPIEFCNRIAPKYEEAWKLLNISYNFFIRTTDPRHKKVVGEVMQKIYDAGDIYKDKYEGWYCTGCEAFKTDKELIDGHCPLHSPEKTVKKSEENWFFKLSKYIPEIIELIENPETNYIFPENKKLEILAKLKAGVNDVSISREKVKWGIPVPWDTEHTVYVWIDALINYYSATQFLENKNEFWPTDLHILGKEILWFHTVIWQAMLLSAGIKLPVKTYTHSFYMIDGQKMSKSLGNVISPSQLIDLFGVDGTRYLVARSFPTENDADVGIDRFKEKYNADLANNLGNLVSRVCKLGEGLKINNQEVIIDNKYKILINNLKFDEAIGWVFENYIDKSNNRLNEVTPWKLEANDPKRIEVLTECAQNLKIAATYLESIIPETSKKILDLLNETIKPLENGLFPRLK